MTWKKRNIIIITMNFLALLLYMTTMLQRENPIGQTLTVILLAASGSLLVIRMEIHMAFHAQTKQLQYQNLDLFRFLSSIIIIVLHVRPFFTVSYEIDMAINNIIGRICVPFFFFISGYFAAKQEQKKPDYIRSYIRSMIPVYLLWSAVYLPWSLSLAAPYIQQVSGLLCTIGLPTAIQNLLLLLLVPLAVIVALLYSGVYYHLWYFPALLLSMLVLRWWKRKYSLMVLLTVSFVLLLFGATETYYGFCGQFFQSLLHYYYAVFFTTRNFLFFALFYVTLGYWMGKQEQPASSLCFLKLLLSIAALVGEGMLLQTTQRLDSNILLACVPLVYYLFSCLLYTNIHVPQLSEIPFRAISKYYYLVHPLMILFVHAWFPQVDSFWMAVAKVVCVLCCTHICTLLLIHMKKRYPAVPL
ncbi:acyltransferase family protein [[Clostridium] innocuum]|uniref:acyltransferase family protein n=1 Tax=Clostridium innocuum TaxID=1522 RepID=UPI000D6B01D4|nr:acyltransferase [[Clostridium] innocuum]PWJ18589.1 peptidoglycan/LPS O-acetylase OafA/YrhL [[Clostridium] innocuum]SSA39029.1 Peptidoglycan/LPS O-acetylase OafA/YrhL, contains acyltransferase and SGNH-hydrolase domains [[Clostridium] innocuum]